MGDPKAVGDLYDRCSGIVYLTAARIVGYADADDITQQTFIKAVERIHQYRGESPLCSWCRSIATHLSMDFVRRDKRRSTTLSEFFEHRKTAGAEIFRKWFKRNRGSVMTSSDQRLAVAIARKALKQMSRQCKILITLKWTHSYPYADLAEWVRQDLRHAEWLGIDDEHLENDEKLIKCLRDKTEYCVECYRKKWQSLWNEANKSK